MIEGGGFSGAVICDSWEPGFGGSERCRRWWNCARIGTRNGDVRQPGRRRMPTRLGDCLRLRRLMRGRIARRPRSAQWTGGGGAPGGAGFITAGGAGGEEGKHRGGGGGGALGCSASMPRGRRE